MEPQAVRCLIGAAAIADVKEAKCDGVASGENQRAKPSRVSAA